MIKAIIFDSDDTIFNSKGLGSKTLKLICKKHKVKFDKAKYKTLTGMSRCDKAKELFGENNDIWLEWDKAYEKDYAKYAIALPNAITTLKKLKKQNILFFIFSTKNSWLIKQALEKFGVIDLFEEIVGGEAKPKKPAPKLMEIILKEYNIKKNEVILVGDSKVDEVAAQNIGVDLIQVNYLNKTKLKSAKHIITNLKQLIDLYN
jgi:HAD superfamily hydrolase (TIGR01549 family)